MISCGCRYDEDGVEDGDESDLSDGFEGELGVDANGRLTERKQVGGHEVIVHYDDIPPSDITTVQGIPCTTALRTVIDIAPEVSADRLDRMVADCLERRLFTAAEAWQRLAQPDMHGRPGAELLGRSLRDQQL